MSEGASVHVLVSGRVQGVGFRWHARHRARELGLDGWVANLDDGRVETWAQGSPGAVDEFVAWLGVGEPPARVERTSVDRGRSPQFVSPPYARVGFGTTRP